MLPADDEFDAIAHRSEDEEADVLSTVAAITKRDAQLQAQLLDTADATAAASSAQTSDAPGPGLLQASLSII